MADENKMSRQYKVLLVDDDIIFGKIIQVLAAEENISLTYVKNVRDAYQLSNWSFDMAIIDYDLGAVTGIQLSYFLEHYLKPKAVLLVSAHPEVEKKTWPECVKDFVNKSDGPMPILRAAKKLLQLK